MPGFRTHYLFGRNTFDSTGGMYEAIRKHPECYNLGQQGPDIFFYCPTAHVFYKEHLGGRLHGSETMAFFSALLDCRDRFLTSDEKSICDAYIMGFIGHYCLDTTIHPYIHYRTKKLKNINRENYVYGIHVLLETDIDAAVLKHYLNKKPSEFSCAKTISVSKREQAIISMLLSFGIRRAYPELYASAFHVSFAITCARLCHRLLHDPSGRKKAFVRFALDERLIGNAFLSSLIASDFHRTYKDPCNLKHHRWCNPWDEDIASDASVYDLMKQAADDYTRRLALYDDLVERAPESYFYCKNALLADIGNLSYDTGLPIGF